MGVLEEMDATLRVMQALLPYFFSGIHDKFGGEQTCKSCTSTVWRLFMVWLMKFFPPSVQKNRQSYSKQDEEELEAIMKNQLVTEYEFYSFIKQRVVDQAKTLRH